ncbi:FAD synthase [Candidatus Woesearchaeota archaeon]|nr:FAD synthase [Candidatus Woesearchaeota archaeon]
MKKVMAFGSFDVIHPGHVYFLKKAKELGDFLAVVVARDSTIEKVKGKMPMYNENHRLNQIRDLKIADIVLLGSKKNYFEGIMKIKPDVIALGYDQKFLASGENLPRHAEIVRIKPYREKVYKSSLLKKKNRRKVL